MAQPIPRVTSWRLLPSLASLASFLTSSRDILSIVMEFLENLRAATTNGMMLSLVWRGAPPNSFAGR